MKRLFLLLIFMLFVSIPPLEANTHTIGFLGDSNTDEYRANDNRGGAYAATTLNWMELLVRYRDVNAGAWGSYSEPRRSGYEFNWSRSGVKTCDLAPQANGLAGQVDTAVIYIGTNDFHTWNGTYAEIYNGTLNDSGVAAKVNSIVGCIADAVTTLQNAGNVRIVLANFTDPSNSATFIAQFPSASGRQRVTNAINDINVRLDALIIERSLVRLDMSSLLAVLGSRVDANGFLHVGNALIDTVNKGDEPHHTQLGDSVGHLGTVVNGLLANIITEAIGGITPFTDDEILTYAGIITVTPTVTPSRTPTSTSTPTVTPTFVITCTPTVTPTRTPTASPTVTATRTPTNIPTTAPTITPSLTATRTLTITPTTTGRVIRLTSLTSDKNFVFDGIVENGVFTESTSPRFTFSSGWQSSGTMGRNNSPFRYAYGSGKYVTFTTFAQSLIIQSYSDPQMGSFQATVGSSVYVFNLNATISAFVDVSIP